MKKRHFQVSTQIYVAIFWGLVAGFVAIHAICKLQSLEEHTYEFTTDNFEIAQDGLSFSMSASKSWTDDELHTETPIGAQYDGVVTNNSNYLFQKWTVDLVFSEELTIDSYWNGDFKAEGNHVFFTAQGNPLSIDAGTQKTFGAVMYSREQIATLESATLRGYLVYQVAEMPAFWILVVLSFAWLIFFTANIFYKIRAKQYRKQQQLDSEIIEQTMHTFTGFIDAKDPYTNGHSSRVASYSAEIAKRMGMHRDEVKKLYYITLMHDCGKIGIPDSILKKPGQLTKEEFELIKSHTTLGNTILKNFTAIPEIRDGAHFHHERYDGAGYPTGLKGKEIPLYSRIICVADSYDAMSTNRCYRCKLDKDTILNELTINSGRQFDPIVVPYMVDMILDGFVDKIQQLYPNGQEDCLLPSI